MNRELSRNFYTLKLTRNFSMPIWLWGEMAKVLPSDVMIVNVYQDYMQGHTALILHSSQFPLVGDCQNIPELSMEIKAGTYEVRPFIYKQDGTQEFLTFNTIEDGQIDGFYKGITALQKEAKEMGQDFRCGFKLLVSQDIPQGEVHLVIPNQQTKIINIETKEERKIYESTKNNRRIRD